jgi:hypothetical protein
LLTQKKKLQKEKVGRNMLPSALSGPPPHFDRATAPAQIEGCASTLVPYPTLNNFITEIIIRQTISQK